MHVLAFVLPLLAVADAAVHSPPYLRHRRMMANQEQQRQLTPKDIAQPAPRANTAHAEAHQVIKRVVKKRGQQCRVRPAASSSSSSSSSQAPSATSSAPSDPSATIDSQNAWAHGDKGGNKDKPSASSSSWTPPAASAPADNNHGGGGLGGIVSGLLNWNDDKCGWCGSSGDTPNGSEDWLNCGINNGGWTPPHVGIKDLVAADLNANGVFAPCAQYIDKFNQYGHQYGVHPIMLASFAMQESTCNPWATGGNGEAGMMQIAGPNCNNPSGDCYEIDYNIRRGAELFSDMIKHNGGNVLAAIGSYNGWRVGMTQWDATRAKDQGNCFAQNNLDYIHQFVNGWMQGKSAYNMGTYFNLKGC